MIIKEYRIVLPLTVEEYQIAQLFSVAEASKENTGGGEGIEVLKNESYSNGQPLLADKFTSGQFTHKIYHIDTKVPAIVRALAPKGSLKFHEEAWNAYPYCKTVVTNPDYMKENFLVKVESYHLPDRGETENAHALSPDLLKKREVIYLNITDDSIVASGKHKKEYKPEKDPKKVRSEKAGRGPLAPDFAQTCQPFMCCYKLVTVEFKWFGLQGRMESFISKQYPRLFTNFHREVFCWMDRWFGMTLEDIRKLEEQTRLELEEARKTGEVKGMVASE